MYKQQMPLIKYKTFSLKMIFNEIVFMLNSNLKPNSMNPQRESKTT